MKEPVLLISGGGTAFVQAVLQLLLAFNVPITSAQQAALTTVAGLLIAWYARSHVTPMATLPAGVADKIANNKASGDKP